MSGKADHWLPTRRSLLQRLKKWDDEEGWRDFFNTYSRLLYTIALRSGFDDAEAQDIVQETIIAVAKHIPDFNYDPSIGSFKSWLLRIARRRIIDHLRKRLSQPQRAHDPDTGTSRTSFMSRIPDPKPGDLNRIWNQEWQKHIFEAALQKVKDRASATDFQIFDCYVLKQWPVKQVAAALSVSEAHIYVAKSRVSSLLKKEVRLLEERML